MSQIMGGEVIIGSLIIAIGVGGNIWWLQRNRTLDFNGQAGLGRSDDRLVKKLDQVLKRFEEQD